MSENEVKSPSIVSCPFICLYGVGGQSVTEDVTINN